jgi:hypothetical protein
MEIGAASKRAVVVASRIIFGINIVIGRRFKEC